MLLKDLLIKITADTSGLRTEMTSAGKSIDELKSKTEGLSTAGASLANLMKGVFTAGIASISAAFAASTFQTTKFDDTIVRAFQDASDGASINTETFSKFARTVRDMGAASIFGANQSAAALKLLASQNLSTEKSIESLREAQLLATSTGEDLSASSYAIGASLRTFQNQGLQASDVATYLGVAALKGSLNIGQFSSSLRLIGPLADSAGISFKELVASVTTLSDKGIEGMRAMMGMSSALREMIDPSSQLNKLFKSWGVNVVDSNGKLKSLTTIVDSVSTAIRGNKNRYNELLGAAGPAFTRLVEGAKDYKATLKDFESGREVLKNVAKEYESTLPGAFATFSSSVQESFLRLGEVFKIPLIQFLDTMSESLMNLSLTIKPSDIESLTSAFDDLGKSLPMVVEVFKGLGTLLSWVGKTIGSVITAIKYYTTLVGALSGGAGIKQASQMAETAMQNVTGAASTPQSREGYFRPTQFGPTSTNKTPLQSPTIDYAQEIRSLIENYRLQVEHTSNSRLKTIVNVFDKIIEVDVENEKQLREQLEQQLLGYTKSKESMRAPSIQ